MFRSDSGAACASALEHQGYKVTRIDVDRTSPTTLPFSNPTLASMRCMANGARMAASRACLKRWKSPIRILASGIRSGHGQGARQDGFKAAGVPVADGIVASREEAARGASHATALCHQACRGRIERWRFHRARGSGVSAAGADAARLVLWRRYVERYIGGRELTCAVMGDRAARRDRNPARRGAQFLRLRSKIRKRRLTPHSTGTRFHRIFTSLFRNWLLMHITHWAAGGLAAPIFVSTIGRREQANLSALRLILNQA